MLDKLKITALVGIALQVLRAFVPDIELPAGFDATVVDTLANIFLVIVPVGAGWFKKESSVELAKLS